MPTYIYECPNHGEFEEFHSIMIKLEHCPQCAAKGEEVKIVRLISGGSGKGIMNLTDEEFKAGLKDEVNKIKKRASREENYLANLVGPSYRGNQ